MDKRIKKIIHIAISVIIGLVTEALFAGYFIQSSKGHTLMTQPDTTILWIGVWILPSLCVGYFVYAFLGWLFFREK